MTLKNIFIFSLFLLIVLAVNLPATRFNMMYPEQASLYLANQTILNFHDLLAIYLHPKWLHTNIPFFRPSGHFLMYQIFAPLLGWHNTQGFLMINFVFLTLIGLVSIKLYEKLFPSFKWGGYIAFAIYMMHPALSLTKFTVMHFEFAYIFFSIFAIFCFTIFYQESTPRFLYLWLALCSYAIAVTFKESAIMIGPLLIIYALLQRKYCFYVVPLISISFLLLAYYLAQAWLPLSYAPRAFNWENSLGTVNAFLRDVFALNHNLLSYGRLPFENSAWRTIVFTPFTKAILWVGSIVMLVQTSKVLLSKHPAVTVKKSIILLYSGILCFCILPFLWGMGAPWHHNLTILCISLLIGFSVESLVQLFNNSKKALALCCFTIAGFIAVHTYYLNVLNIEKYMHLKDGALGLALNQNAIFKAPHLKINPDSLLVVEDSQLHNDYLLGNAAYPLLLSFTQQEYREFKKHQQRFTLPFQPMYSGTLFRYGLLLPKLKEEIYPFKIEQMEEVPNEIIYDWLAHFQNIFCVGYDTAGNWYDKTEPFKRFLNQEKNRRGLNIHHYRKIMHLPPSFSLISKQELTIDNMGLCAFNCDQVQGCKGFQYKEFSCKLYQTRRLKPVIKG